MADAPPHPPQREIRSLRHSPPFSHHERALLLQHRRDTLSVQRSLARLQRELQATARLLQVGTVAWAGGRVVARRRSSPVCFVGMC